MGLSRRSSRVTIAGVIHVYCDGSFDPGTGRAGIGVVIVLSQRKAVAFARPVRCRSSMGAERAAAAAALAWLRPGADVCLVCDNAATLEAVCRAQDEYAHLRTFVTVLQHGAPAWPMQRAHTLAQLGASGETVVEHVLPGAPGVARVVRSPASV